MVKFHAFITGLPVITILILCCYELFRLTIKQDRSPTAATLVLGNFYLLGLIVSYLSGLIMFQTMPELSSELVAQVEIHETRAKLTLLTALPFVALFYQRLKLSPDKLSARIYYLYLAALFFVLIMTLLTGQQGGALVFDYAVGVTKK
ncbi:hypothetical protein JNK13_08405 [bacterium]|nr:hypothetical protein [bacterium]